MIDRAREIAKMMGYESIDATLEAIGSGELILLKLPEEQRLLAAEWLHDKAPELQAEDEALAEALADIADSVELASELIRYPAQSDICEMNLPHGWPSYCEKRHYTGRKSNQ